MKQAGLVRSGFVFVIHAVLTGQRTQLRSGTYTFSGSLSIPQVLAIVTKRQSLQNEIAITLLEGWTAQQMGEILSQALPFSTEDYVTAAEPFEGYLFPDTYRFFVDATAADVIERQRNTFDQKFTPEMRVHLEEQGRTLAQAVILASIVEKEAQTLSDKQVVADIFWRRLDNGKRLESDATINYVTKKNDTTPSTEDLFIESAYNTYRNVGLPPTAICNPGFDALYAVIYPAETDYWYFLTTPDGEMKYSTTYEEHLTYKNQYYP
ncbi:MAG: Aminodeoxychorismate lyase [uncultured bacterium]|nr:MAG: Aminodeoxychorismate lyase [uncultured bacterium]